MGPSRQVELLSPRRGLWLFRELEPLRLAQRSQSTVRCRFPKDSASHARHRTSSEVRRGEPLTRLPQSQGTEDRETTRLEIQLVKSTARSVHTTHLRLAHAAMGTRQRSAARVAIPLLDTLLEMR